MNSKKLFIFRHGQTDWNALGKMQGHADIPLNAIGIEQAHTLGKLLKDKHLECIVSSDLKRALETAQIVASHTNIPIITTPALREICVGSRQGTLWAELMLTPDAHHWSNHDPRYDDFGFPGGETKAQAQKRIRTWLEQFLTTTPYTTIGISSHGKIMRLFLRSCTDAMYQPLENCAVIALEYEVAKKQWHIITL